MGANRTREVVIDPLLLLLLLLDCMLLLLFCWWCVCGWCNIPPPPPPCCCLCVLEPNFFNCGAPLRDSGIIVGVTSIETVSASDAAVESDVVLDNSGVLACCC